LAKARSVEDQLNKVIGKMEDDQKRLLKNIWFDGHAPLYASENDAYARLLKAEQKAEADRMKAGFENLRKDAKPKYPVAHAIQGGGNAMQVYIRGNPASKGEWVARGTLEILAEEPRPTDPEVARNHSFSRLDLAEAIASQHNPLTARVIVNRVWQWHFGKGLVTTSSNFGLLGEAPTHPELLDWLTINFMEKFSTRRRINFPASWILKTWSGTAKIGTVGGLIGDVWKSKPGGMPCLQFPGILIPQWEARQLPLVRVTGAVRSTRASVVMNLTEC
jgi:hypothetical protein